MGGLIQELKERLVLPTVGMYVASTWVLIEILDRLVERYLLSPYLTDVVFWGRYTLIPAVMIRVSACNRKNLCISLKFSTMRRS